jgi:hypothetical protein
LWKFQRDEEGNVSISGMATKEYLKEILKNLNEKT